MEMDLDGTTVTLGGIAKGSGMIHPNMATMLALLTCDAAVASEVWTGMLKRAVSRSFNVVRCAYFLRVQADIHSQSPQGCVQCSTAHL
jgi:N-acetylglutamate synthase/N-acetylornithine aminotransferase